MVHVEVDVAPPFREQVDVEDLRRLVRQTLELERVSEGELTVVITDAEQVRELNRAFRNVDATTDVLSFPMGSMAESSPLPEEVPPYLGDVVIAFPVAEAQARRYGHSVQEELRLLVVHGVLHLLGYDHATPEEEAEMWARQERILGRAYVGPRGERRSPGVHP